MHRRSLSQGLVVVLAIAIVGLVAIEARSVEVVKLTDYPTHS